MLQKWPMILSLFTVASIGNADTNISVIDGIHDSSGLLNFNVTSGNNIQNNAFALTYGKNGSAQAQTMTQQTFSLQPTTLLPYQASSTIGENAFIHNSGITALNQASGMGNLQSNQIAMAFNLTGAALADNALDQSYATAPLSIQTTSKNMQQNFVGINEGAFTGTTGLVQLNQTAGIGNQTANGFALSIVPGAK